MDIKNKRLYRQILSPDQIKKLAEEAEKENTYSLAYKGIDLERAVCMHIDDNGESTLFTTGGQYGCRCSICGKRFSLSLDKSLSDVQKTTNDMLDIIQTIKIIFTDMPRSMVQELFPILMFIEKIPSLYESAQSNFKAYEQEHWKEKAIQLIKNPPYPNTEEYEIDESIIEHYAMFKDFRE